MLEEDGDWWQRVAGADEDVGREGWRAEIGDDEEAE